MFAGHPEPGPGIGRRGGLVGRGRVGSTSANGDDLSLNVIAECFHVRRVDRTHLAVDFVDRRRLVGNTTSGMWTFWLCKGSIFILELFLQQLGGVASYARNSNGRIMSCEKRNATRRVDDYRRRGLPHATGVKHGLALGPHLRPPDRMDPADPGVEQHLLEISLGNKGRMLRRRLERRRVEEARRRNRSWSIETTR